MRCFFFVLQSHLHLDVSYSAKFLHLYLTDSAWQYGSPGFQELKAEVTEVPAPDGSEDNTGLCLKCHSSPHRTGSAYFVCLCRVLDSYTCFSAQTKSHQYSPLKSHPGSECSSHRPLLLLSSLFCLSDLANMTLALPPPADSIKANTAINTAANGARIPESCQSVGMRARLNFMFVS